MITRILANTPPWVWVVLLGLLILGYSQTKTRALGMGRVLILPAVMTLLSIGGMASSFGAKPAAFAAWLVAAAAVAWLASRRPAPAGTSYDQARAQFELPGSWVPMLLILGIFSVKYAAGAALAIAPGLATATGFATVVSALYGAMSGLFLGRTVRLWNLARHPERAAIEPAAARSPLRVAAWLAGGIALLFVGAIAAMIAFGTSAPPAPFAAVTGAALTAEPRNLPPLETFRARDGVQLAYRAYRAGDGKRVALLVHGSSTSSRSMHGVAQALAQAGVTAYALDMRGHGGSGRKGDIDYVGQLDDDLADFAALLRARHPQAQMTLVGHSSGGGFTLRTAGGRNRDLFDRYLLLSPMLHQQAPTTRPNAGGWVQPYIPRIIALSILDRLGLPWFQDLPVLAFALPPEAASRSTMSYSYRLQASFRPHDDYLGDVRAITRPTRILIGAGDEMFIAERYAPLLEPLQPKLGVKVLDGVSHIGMVTQPAALAAIAAEF